MKNQVALKYRLAPFVFEPWRELFKQVKSEVKNNSEKREQRLQELRRQLKEKEERLKELRANLEPAPAKEFLQSVGQAKKKKEKSVQLMSGYGRAKAAAEAELATVAQELARLRKARKSRREVVQYYKRQLQKVDVVAPRVGALQRKRAAAEEQLNYEREQLKIAKADQRTLIAEHEELDFELEDYRDTAYFDATDVDAVQEPRTEPRGADKASAPLSRKYRQDMMEVIIELVDSGVKIESIESIFESVFQCVQFTVRGFPTNNIIKKLFRDHEKMGEEMSRNLLQ